MRYAPCETLARCLAGKVRLLARGLVEFGCSASATSQRRTTPGAGASTSCSEPERASSAWADLAQRQPFSAASRKTATPVQPS